ncbi:MAG: hypothetical protein ACRELF_10085 [Gemmataceae bacterium]
MPPRWLCLLIGMFWLTMTGWLFWRDLWPNWLPGAPPYHIDDVDEVHNDSQMRTSWTVERGNGLEAPLKKVFRASTWVEYHKDEDTYSLHAEFLAKIPSEFTPTYIGAQIFKIDSMTSEYRVTRGGRLHSLQAKVTGIYQGIPLKEKLYSLFGSLLPKQPAKKPKSASPSAPDWLRVWGEVRDNQFTGHCSASVGDYVSKPIDLPPTAVSYTGSVLMPLHPVNQISGLHPGQRWHQPLVDPLRDALPGLSGGVRSLNARVLPQPEMLTRGNHETSCLVIEYTDDENKMMGRTWVEQSSNRVLRQEAILEDVRWIMTRDPERRDSNQADRPPRPTPSRNEP